MASGAVETFSEEDFDIVLDVNLKATFFMCSASIPALRESQGNRNAATYCASKGALTIMTKALALDLVPGGVRCNSVSPGDVGTPIPKFQAERYGNGDQAAYYQDLLVKYPQGEAARFIQPGEVADLAFFLCQSGVRSTIGADLVIDCGVSAGN